MRNIVLKDFFSLKYFKELKFLIFFESFVIIIGLLMLKTPSIQSLNLNLFNGIALIMTLFVWFLSCFVDRKTYFNLATFLTTVVFGYGVFWFMLEVLN